MEKCKIYLSIENGEPTVWLENHEVVNGKCKNCDLTCSKEFTAYYNSEEGKVKFSL